MKNINIENHHGMIVEMNKMVDVLLEEKEEINEIIGPLVGATKVS